MFYCLDKTDQFGNPINNTIFGSNNSGHLKDLHINFRPCVPKQRTPFNKNENCLIDDVTNKTQLN